MTTATNQTDAPAASIPMFVPQQTQQGNESDIDLDELFKDCYFEDFPVPANAPSSSAPAVPLVSNSEFYQAQPQAQVQVQQQQQQNSLQQQEQQNSLTLKRKADDIKPTPVLSNVTSSSEINTAPTKKAKPLTDQQRNERRSRNRKHAEKSRLRKKFLLQNLQEQINSLQSELKALQDVIRKECPGKAEQLLESVSGPKGKFTPLSIPSGFGPVKTLIEPDYRLMTALSGSQQNFAISDPSLPDNPIVYVSQGFLELTGYTLNYVLGRNCRFLQGADTDQGAIDIIRKGIKDGVDTSVCLLNYKADGTPFWNQFFVGALRDAENNVVNYVGVQCEVSKAVVDKQMAELKNRISG